MSDPVSACVKGPVPQPGAPVSTNAPGDARPSTPALSREQTIALGRLSRGENISAAARAAGVNRGTVHRWIKEDPDFCAAYHAWQAQIMESGRAQVLTMADQALTTIREAIKNGNLSASLTVARALGLLTSPRRGPENADVAAAQFEIRKIRREVRLRDRYRRAGWDLDGYRSVSLPSKPAVKPPITDEPFEEDDDVATQ